MYVLNALFEDSFLTLTMQDNVLLSPTLRPLLTDFGVSRRTIASATTTTTASSGGTLRWKAPELLGIGEERENEKTDIWAFGMTLLVSHSARLTSYQANASQMSFFLRHPRKSSPETFHIAELVTFKL